MFIKKLKGSLPAFVVLVLLAFALVVSYGIVKSRAAEPTPATIELNDAESKILIEAAREAEAARLKFAQSYDTICRLKGADPAKYDLAENKDKKGLVNLVPKPPAPQK